MFAFIKKIGEILKKIDLIIDMLIYLIDNLPDTNKNKSITINAYMHRKNEIDKSA